MNFDGCTNNGMRDSFILGRYWIKHQLIILCVLRALCG